jgi:hypothetical protein
MQTLLKWGNLFKMEGYYRNTLFGLVYTNCIT